MSDTRWQQTTVDVIMSMRTYLRKTNLSSKKKPVSHQQHYLTPTCYYGHRWAMSPAVYAMMGSVVDQQSKLVFKKVMPKLILICHQVASLDPKTGRLNLQKMFNINSSLFTSNTLTCQYTGCSNLTRNRVSITKKHPDTPLTITMSLPMYNKSTSLIKWF